MASGGAFDYPLLMTSAYSYLRFSSPGQASNDSVRRQLELRDKWLASNAHLGLVLVEDMRDLGVSAFRGANRHKGALAAFLALVEAGKIARGSYLLIENLDRLSREAIVPATHLLLGILIAGIVVVTVADNHIYRFEEGQPSDSLFLLVMQSVVILARAASESARKSQIGTANWSEKRANIADHMLTRTCPHWLEPDPDWPNAAYKFRVVSRHALTILKIFELCARGYGATTITTYLVDNNIEPFSFGRRKDGGRWNDAHVRDVLHDRAVIGELALGTRDSNGKRVLTGEIDRTSYAPAIPLVLWERAQVQLQIRKDLAPIRAKRHVNLFAGFSRCAHCEGSMVRHGGATVALRCRKRYADHSCKKGRAYKMGDLEWVVPQIAAAYVRPRPDQPDDTSAEKLAKLRVAIDAEQRGLDALLDAFATPDADDLRAIQRRKDRLEVLRSQLKSLEHHQVKQRVVSMDDVAEIVTHVFRAALSGDPDARVKLASGLRQWVLGMRCYWDGEVVVAMANDVRFGVRGDQVAWMHGPVQGTVISDDALPQWKLSIDGIQGRIRAVDEQIKTKARVG